MLGATRYSEFRRASRVRERSLFVAVPAPSELELQARWFAGDFGRQFRSVAGDAIEIVQFGVWNREAGPDFTEAVVRSNGGAPIRGAIEFDLTDRSWESHGHATNEAFDGAVLHVFVQSGGSAFFTRTRTNRNVPQVRVDLAALNGLTPVGLPLARAGRCQAPLQGLSEERIVSVLTAAAQFRLQRKAARLRRIMESHGRDAALFQELAAALGYKRNKLPFTLLAQRVSLAVLRAAPREAESLLFGVAGFLSAPDLAAYRSDTRAYVRELWDTWWRRHDEMGRLILPLALWKFSGARPLNHPQRRLCALSLLAADWRGFVRSFVGYDFRKTRQFLLGLTHPFWNFHYTLRAAPAATAMALIGESRVRDIIANVLLPLAEAEGHDGWSDYAKLSAPLSNRRVETAATRLFAQDDRRKRFTKSIAFQQGLLQVYEDFCLQDNSDCAQCPFPEQMQTWK
ncbi:MAG: DUF2851 family protein [Chthoniobacterales bacterium]